MRPKAITLTIVLVVVLAELLDPAGQPSSGLQQIPGNRKPACTCFCGGASPASFNLFDAEEIDAAKCFGGPLPADKCGDYFKSLPDENQKNFCDRLKTEGKSTASCPVLKALAQYCEEKFPPDKKPDKKCEKPTPWFGTTSSGCKDVQNPEITVNSRGVSLEICGLTLFSNGDNPNYTVSVSDSVYAAALRKLVKSRIGSRLCCDKFWEALRNGTGCLPAVDLDCDGIPNKTDTVSLNPSMPDLFPDLNIFTRPEGAPIDPFPEGFDPGDPDFLPPAEKCDCKWELMKGTLTCSPDGKQGHVYQASWRCPSTRNERFTRKVLPATAPCK